MSVEKRHSLLGRGLRIDSSAEPETGSILVYDEDTRKWKPTAKPSVTGSTGGNAALESLLSALDGLGIIDDNTT